MFRLVAESIYLHKPGYRLKYSKQNIYLNQTSAYLVGSLEEEIALLWLESGTVPLAKPWYHKKWPSVANYNISCHLISEPSV